jgi:hypothetical protein
MRILIATPLYPPDIAPSATYVKDLAQRFSEAFQGDSLVIATYTPLPEEVAGVSVLSLSKPLPLLLRLISYTQLLGKAARDADVILLENGSSTELPVVFLSYMRRLRYVMHISDIAAHTRTQTGGIKKFIERFAASRAITKVDHLPLPRPEVLPFSPYPTEAFATYEASWKEHVSILKEAIAYERRK